MVDACVCVCDAPVSTTVCPEPQQIWTTPRSFNTSTGTGRYWSLVSPRPSCPSSPRPQLYIIVTGHHGRQLRARWVQPHAVAGVDTLRSSHRKARCGCHREAEASPRRRPPLNTMQVCSCRCQTGHPTAQNRHRTAIPVCAAYLQCARAGRVINSQIYSAAARRLLSPTRASDAAGRVRPFAGPVTMAGRFAKVAAQSPRMWHMVDAKDQVCGALWACALRSCVGRACPCRAGVCRRRTGVQARVVD